MSRRRGRINQGRPQEHDQDALSINIQLDQSTIDAIDKMGRNADGLADLDQLESDLREAGLPDWADRVATIREAMSGNENG